MPLTAFQASVLALLALQCLCEIKLCEGRIFDVRNSGIGVVCFFYPEGFELRSRIGLQN